MKLNNLSGLIPVRALLCSYRCFNSSGHDYYGVAFPWPQSRPLFKGVCPREVTLSYHVICSSNMLMLICVLIKLSWPINTCKLYTCVFPLNLHQKSFAREIKFFQWYVHVMTMVFLSNILLMFKVAGVSVWTMYRICIGLFEMHIRNKLHGTNYHKNSFLWEYTYKCADDVLS